MTGQIFRPRKAKAILAQEEQARPTQNHVWDPQVGHIDMVINFAIFSIGRPLRNVFRPHPFYDPSGHDADEGNADADD